MDRKTKSQDYIDYIDYIKRIVINMGTFNNHDYKPIEISYLPHTQHPHKTSQAGIIPIDPAMPNSQSKREAQWGSSMSIIHVCYLQ